MAKGKIKINGGMPKNNFIKGAIKQPGKVGQEARFAQVLKGFGKK